MKLKGVKHPEAKWEGCLTAQTLDGGTSFGWAACFQRLARDYERHAVTFLARAPLGWPSRCSGGNPCSLKVPDRRWLVAIVHRIEAQLIQHYLITPSYPIGQLIIMVACVWPEIEIGGSFSAELRPSLRLRQLPHSPCVALQHVWLGHPGRKPPAS